MPESIDLRTLIPHQGTMCLNERVLQWDDNRVLLATRSHAAADNPLRCNGHLRAVHLCEYGAQAMAVHGGLLARAAGRRAEPGLLVAVRDVRLHLRTIEHLPGELQVEAERLLASAASWQYAFRVSHAGQLLAAGRAAVMLNPLPCG
jgi:predicted hotdog family 3-hydroxylacyl-ACP dehydratase